MTIYIFISWSQDSRQCQASLSAICARLLLEVKRRINITGNKINVTMMNINGHQNLFMNFVAIFQPKAVTAFQGSFLDSFNDNNCLSSSGKAYLLLQHNGLGKVKLSYGFILLLIDTVMCVMMSHLSNLKCYSSSNSRHRIVTFRCCSNKPDRQRHANRHQTFKSVIKQILLNDKYF